MTKELLLFGAACAVITSAGIAEDSAEAPPTAKAHPESTDGSGWQALFSGDLDNAVYPEGVWSVDGDGVLTATEDQAIWSEKDYDNFVLDLEFKTADGTNSGVIVYASDIENWIPNSVEIQIADDHSEQWSKAAPSWQCGAFFGHKAAEESAVKKPGEWNRMTVTARDDRIWVVLNGEAVNDIDLSKFTSAKEAPDGTEIPAWLSKPWSELPTKGRIGFQGKHAGAPIWFRNVKVRPL